MAPTFQNPWMLAWLGLVAAVAAAGAMGLRRRLEAARRLGMPPEARIRRRWRLRRLGALLALALIVVALARPGWRPRAEPLAGGGRDVVFVLDVSRSMLARDQEPDRLTSARLAIQDLADHLPAGDRFGLVAFAGSASILCPLTTDRAFFHQALDGAGPDSVAYGGTRIGDALQKAADKLLGGPDRGEFQDVILLTDGGDQGSDVARAVRALNADQAALLVIGLGSASVGARIPVGDRFVVYHGREVWSRQQPAFLEKMVRGCRMGLYLDAGTRPFDLPDVYRRLVEHSAATRTSNRAVGRPEEEFSWFLGAALFTLLALGGTFRNLRRTAAAWGVAVVLTAVPRLAAAPAAAPAATSSAEGRMEQEAGLYLEAARTAAGPETEARDLYDAATCRLNAARQVEREAAQVARMVAEIQGHLAAEAENPAVGPSRSSAGPGQEPEAALPAGYAFIGGNIPSADAAALFGQSAHLYEAALQLTPEFPEAARNLEIARALWEKAIAAQKARSQAANSSKNQASDSRSGDAGTGRANAQNVLKKPADSSLAGFLNQDLPPLNLSPQDLIRQENEDDRRRLPPAVPKHEPGEEDW